MIYQYFCRFFQCSHSVPCGNGIFSEHETSKHKCVMRTFIRLFIVKISISRIHRSEYLRFMNIISNRFIKFKFLFVYSWYIYEGCSDEMCSCIQPGHKDIMDPTAAQGVLGKGDPSAGVLVRG